MALRIYDAILHLILDESTRDEAIGDLWESDYRFRQDRKTSSLKREAIIFWRFLLLVKLSIETAIKTLLHPELDENISSAFGCLSELEEFYERSDIDASVIEFLRHYCNNSYTDRSRYSVAQRQSYDSLFKPENLRIRKIQFWVEQADKLIKEGEAITGYRGNCEAVINSLVLSNLIQRLNSYSPKPIDCESFRKFIEQTEISNEFVRQYIGFSDLSYIRRLVVQAASLCVYVISWEPGQQSSLHHHGSALDAIKVIQGEMSHWITEPEREIPYEGYELQDEALDLGPPTRHQKGDLVIIDRRHGHQIANLSSERLVTLNFRFGSPPEPEDRCWQMPEDTAKFVWKQIDFVWNKIKQEDSNESKSR